MSLGWPNRLPTVDGSTTVRASQEELQARAKQAELEEQLDSAAGEAAAARSAGRAAEQPQYAEERWARRSGASWRST
eukprot:4623985-Prymnesium_polylepis.1